MGIKYSDVYAEMQGLIDFINKDPDLAARLVNTNNLRIDFSTLLTRGRDEAAYELRAKHQKDEAARLTGMSSRTIDKWAYKYRYRHDMPPMMRMKKADLSNPIDLT
jgi:hypothetical protein